MSKYTELAMERRRQMTPEGRPQYNCCQSVVCAFAQDVGYDEKMAMRAATFFRGGMQRGSVCGAVTGSLMALGLAGIDETEALNAFYRRFRENHADMLNCKDLLRVSAEKGKVKMAHCNGLICEWIGYVETLLRERGIL